jgi:hypothetical protein
MFQFGRTELHPAHYGQTAERVSPAARNGYVAGIKSPLRAGSSRPAAERIQQKWLPVLRQDAL